MNEEVQVSVDEYVNLGEINIEMEDVDLIEPEMRKLIDDTIMGQVFDFIQQKEVHDSKRKTWTLKRQ